MNNQLIIHEFFQKYRCITKQANSRLQQHDLYNAQWSILYILDRFGPLSQTDIWRYLNVEAPTITRTLTRMEDCGWITRTTGADKRERIIQLTEKAKILIPEVKETTDKFEQDMLQNLSQEEKEMLFHLLKKMGSTQHSHQLEEHNEQ
ncbi:MarR family transcriptional regulator [Metabacillus sp. GX 13764]|uniref:MarR family winged helix-turn-helix transcriptional regulator n=1 Tax=Metabacillus kandeliae TaxID=2900151 RepID=UPI001E3AF5E4|nr:MarR family transcriptional regulator [Metabacillus kandeliae]MCD7036519.1 MarR family transcriptional regulator [Metabacillus kandeliae]